MNLREAIGEYVVAYMQYQEVVGMDGDGVERIRRRFGEADERLDRSVAVAEAAVAYMEDQATSVRGLDEFVEQAQQRGKLWSAFIEAQAKAKAAEQS